MEDSGVRVYLLFGAIGDVQRAALLKSLAEKLSVDMTLSEQTWPPSVWYQGSSGDAASTAVQLRLKAVCEELGIPDEEVTTTLDPNRI